MCISGVAVCESCRTGLHFVSDMAICDIIVLYILSLLLYM